MNQYSILLKYIKTILEQDPLVNYITQGGIDESTLNKMTIPILCNIDINSGSFTNGSTVIFNVELACLCDRDINKEVITDNFLKQDNEIDNMNETLAVLNRLWNKMFVDFERNNITASENPVFSAITFGTQKLLDGWLLTFDVEMPNTELDLCS